MSLFVQVPVNKSRPLSNNGGSRLPPIILFAAVFSTTTFRHRRDAVREAWLEAATHSASVVAKFVLTGAERDEQSDAEAAQHGDMLFSNDRLSGYRSISHKTYFVLEHVVRNLLPAVYSVVAAVQPSFLDWHASICPLLFAAAAAAITTMHSWK